MTTFAPTTTESVLIVGSDGTLLFATPDIIHFAGYTFENIIGENIALFIPRHKNIWRRLRHQWIDMLRKHRQQNNPHQTYYINTTAVDRNHQLFTVMLRINPLPESDRFLVIVQSERNSRLATRFEALQSIIGVVSTMNARELIPVVLEQMTRLIPCDGVSIITENQEKLEITSRHLHNGAWQNTSLYPAETIYHSRTGQLIKQNQQPVLINDCLDDPIWETASKQISIESWLGIPIIYHNRFLGIMEFFSQTPGNFSDEDMELAMSFADGIAVAIQNAHIYRSLEQRTQRLALMYDIALAITSPGVDEVLEVIHTRLSQIIDTRTFYIGIYDAKNKEIELKHVYDQGERRPDQTSPMNPETGLIGWVIGHRKTLFIGDIEREEPVQQPLYYGDRPRCIVIVPLITHNTVMGVISVQSYIPDTLTPEDIAMLEAIASPTATAIQNARLLQQTSARAAELEKAYEDLQAAHSLRAELVHNVTHDLRSPLALIRGYTELLQENIFGDLTDEQKHPLKIILAKIETINRLIDDILAVKSIRPETLEKQPTNINEIVYQVIEEARIAYSKQELNFEADCEPQPLVIMADPDRLQRVFDNLIANAVKFSRSGGYIRIHTALHGENKARVTIEDNGIGIPSEQMPHIFEHLYQVHQSAQNDDAQGIGLGLAISQQIIIAHGGKIEVESVESKGSRFYFDLPLERQQTSGI